jgi:lipid-binding SYLF domain-containing protein
MVGVLGAWADAALDTAQLVEKAKFAVETLTADPNLAAFQDLAKRAKGVFIAPELLKAAFVVGASGGSGVLVVRDEKTGKWHGPAFYTLGAASFGLQIGAQASEVAVLAMTERGVTAMLQPSVKLGADASVAAGPVGLGASGATANVSADLVSFSHSKGLYGGISLEGAVLAVRNEWNNTYYGKSVTPTDILVRGAATRPEAAGLIAAVTKLAGR